MLIKIFLEKLSTTPESVEFIDTMATIEANYHFSETVFSNGLQKNEAGQNSGSCKIFSFALLQKLTEQQTLACFGIYYRDDVLKNPETGDNIESLTLYETNFTDDAITIEGSNQTIFFSNHPDLQNVEGISSLTTIDIEPNGILLYRKSQSKIIALSRNCTHEGCQIGEFQYA